MISKPLVILLDNNSGMLSRMMSGTKNAISDRSNLLDLLVLFRAPRFNAFAKESGTLPAVRASESFWIRMISPCWIITICKPLDNTVTNHCVGPATDKSNELFPITDMFGVVMHTPRSVYQRVYSAAANSFAQETSTKDTEHLPFQDVILLDILLEFIADNFVPH